MRDLRDPTMLGLTLLDLSRMSEMATPKGKSRSTLAWLYEHNLKGAILPDYNANPSCIEKYGSANDIEPRFAQIQVR